MLSTVAAGLTVILKVFGVPVQVVPPLVNWGVTVIVAVTGLVPLFVAVNDIFPVPLFANPTEGLLFDQLYDMVPRVLGLVNGGIVTELPLQTITSLILFTTGVGLIVRGTVVAERLHFNVLSLLYIFGVMYKLVLTTEVVVFCTWK